MIVDLLPQSDLASAFEAIRKFGEANRPGVLRELTGRITALWRQNSGGAGKAEHRGATA